MASTERPIRPGGGDEMGYEAAGQGENGGSSRNPPWRLIRGKTVLVIQALKGLHYSRVDDAFTAGSTFSTAGVGP